MDELDTLCFQTPLLLATSVNTFLGMALGGTKSGEQLIYVLLRPLEIHALWHTRMSIELPGTEVIWHTGYLNLFQSLGDGFKFLLFETSASARPTLKGVYLKSETRMKCSESLKFFSTLWFLGLKTHNLYLVWQNLKF